MEINRGRRRAADRILYVVGAAILAVSLAACGTSASADPNSILGGSIHSTTNFGQVKTAIDKLYQDSPNIENYNYRDVTYTPNTRDSVLKVCRGGTVASSLASLELARVSACEPLIYFLYFYGRQNSVPEAVKVARELYWYAATMNRKPHNLQNSLTARLKAWGVK